MLALALHRSPIHGTGVFARRPFAAGETVLVLDDSRLVTDATPLKPEAGEYTHHCDYVARGIVVLQGIPERFINHSCDANAFVQTRADGRHVVARRPIAAGDEITYDYLVNLHGGVRWQCSCGSEACRGEQPESFFDLPVETQRRLLPLLDGWFCAEHVDRMAELERS
jgi:SET domain-containing protein